MALAHGAQEPLGVRDGLVLYLDAANARSYPRTGNTWFDRSGNGNDGTLEGGVGYSGSNFGSLTFDGTDEYVILSTSSQIVPGTSAFTWNFWAKTTRTLSTEVSILFSGNGSNSYYGVIALDNRSGYGLIYYEAGYKIQSGDLSFINNWVYVSFVGNGQTSGSRNLKLYQNGIQVGSTYTSDYNFTPQAWATSPNIGANHSALSENMKGNISNVSYYNRALSATEIAQNYNAFKGRYGLT